MGISSRDSTSTFVLLYNSGFKVGTYMLVLLSLSTFVLSGLCWVNC